MRLSLVAVWVVSLVVILQQVSLAVTLEGRLREKGTRIPLVGVNVYLLPIKLKAVTDSAGRFHLENVPAGEVEWVVSQTGYERLTKHELITEENSEKSLAIRELYLEKESYDTFETTIYGKSKKRDEKTQELSAKQILKLAGTNGDPVKAVQNLPGVARPRSFSSQVVIEGSAPQDTKYAINGHEVPIIFHFGGYGSVLMAEALDRVEYLSAGFGPEYGRAQGGIVGAITRSPRVDRWHLMASVDLLNSSLLIEGPLSTPASDETEYRGGRFLIGARYSYIAALLGLIVRSSPRFNLTLSPSFSDFTSQYEVPVTERDRFSLTTFGSLDTLQFALTKAVGESAFARDTFYSKTAFFRLIPEIVHRHSSITQSRWSMGVGKDWIQFQFGEIFSARTDIAASSRFELERKMNRRWTLITGLDQRRVWNRTEFSIPSAFTGGGGVAGVPEQTQISAIADTVGFYSRNSIFLGEKQGMTLVPSARVDYFSQVSEWIVQPRFAAKLALTDSLTFRAASGLYAQPPSAQELNSNFGNPTLKSPRSIHYTVGGEKDFKEGGSNGFTLGCDLFYKDMQKVVVSSNERVLRNGEWTIENYSNLGTGRAYGFENRLKYDYSTFSGWLSYTLSRSQRTEPSTGEHLFSYDQTHSLTAVALWEYAKNWSASARARYTSGNPYTPVLDSAYDSDADRYLAVRGDLMSARYPGFFSLDLRIDHKWVYDKWILSAYIDLQNATNRQNVEAYQYNYNYTQFEKISLLPIFPSFGVKGEF